MGDLGRISKKEQLYWKSYNKVIGGSISNTKFQRDFMARFTDPESIDFIFKNNEQASYYPYDWKVRHVGG